MTWPVNDRVSKPEPRLGPSLEQRQAFYDYIRAFSNAEFDVFPQYYTEDVTCQLGARTLVGRQGIIDFYSVMFQRVEVYTPPRWPDPAYPQQAHLDVLVDDLDEGEARALELGATRLPGKGRGFRVFADPSQHPFCLTAEVS